MPESRNYETICKVIHCRANGKLNDWFCCVVKWKCVYGLYIHYNHHALEMDLLQFCLIEQAKRTWLFITRFSVQAIFTSAGRDVPDPNLCVETIHFDNQESKWKFIACGVVISTFNVLWSSYRHYINRRDVMGSKTVWVWSNLLHSDIIVYLIGRNQLYIPHQCSTNLPYWIHPILLVLK